MRESLRGSILGLTACAVATGFAVATLVSSAYPAFPGAFEGLAMTVGLLSGLAVALVGSVLISGWINRSVDATVRLAGSVLEGRAPPKITPGGGPAVPRELARLREALAGMAGMLQRQVGSLTDERNQARAVLESMTEAVIALDSNRSILLMNPAAAILFGVDSARIGLRPFLEAVRHHELDTLALEAMAGSTPLSREITLYQPMRRVLRAHAVPCESKQPGSPAIVLVIQDRTELYAYEKLRKDFVANVSHELKSPLTAIRSLTETLLEGALEDREANRKFVSLIDEEATRLSRLIDDLLQLSQIESQEGIPALRPVDLQALVGQVAEAFKPEIAKRELKLTLSLDQAVLVSADPDRLRQVLINLIDNAIKYNRQGGSLDLAASPRGDVIELRVSDTGIGIPETDLSHIFERFYRVDKARSRELGGTGLGLSIVKHIIESHAGSVSVESRLGQGSTFKVTLPRHA